MNTIENIEQARRLSAIKMLKEKFGDYFDDIKTRTGFDLKKIIDVADTRVLERLAHQKEILVESKAFISIPGIERIDISNKYFSLRLLKVDTEKKWDISMYPVRAMKNTNTPVVTGVKKDTDIELHVGRGESALNITLLAGTDAAEAWRLCKRGVVVRNAKGEAYLLTPCRYNHRYANALPVSYVRKRIENIIKHSAKSTPLSFRPFSKHQGKLEESSYAKFVISEGSELALEALDTLPVGGELILENAKGDRVCLRFDCGENSMVEGVPLSVAKEQEKKRSKESLRQPAFPSPKKTTPYHISK